MGFNVGYVPDGHDGANNVALSLEAAVEIKDGVSLVAYGAYTWGIDSDAERYAGDGLLTDYAFAGVGLACSL